MNISIDDVKLAYRKLKNLVYYDKTDLKLRCRLAEFECDPEFEEKLLAVMNVVNSKDSVNEPTFNNWLRQISFRVVPKSLTKGDTKNESGANDGKFISNVTSAKVYEVTKVNYFFDGPIELQLLAVLWIMKEGRVLDDQLGKECYGSRLDDKVGNDADHSAGLFRKYHEHYARWRDTGISKAKQLLTEENTSICILGLDVQEYYYHIKLDFAQIAQLVHEKGLVESEDGEKPSKLAPIFSNLLKCLEAICLTYQEKIAAFLQLTHKDVPPLNAGIPIGLCSSPLLANWYLREFDKAVKTLIRPAYYGRYVDDILMVIPVQEDPSREGPPVETFMERVLVKAGILHALRQDSRYEITFPEGLFLQQSKCILQYFDARHSVAGLEKFQKKLEENGSDFLLLPVDEGETSLEDVAYELLYEGSVNKFRSVKGVAENRYELAKHLAKQTIFHLLTDEPPDRRVSLGLRKFFKGKNAIEFHDLWERVFTFFLIAGDSKAALDFAKQLKTEIKRVRFCKQDITEQLLKNLGTHLELSQAMAHALCNSSPQMTVNCQATPCKVFRQGNLIRHHFVNMPLLNYTTYQGSLIARIIETEVEIDPRRLKLSPRYVHFDECLLQAESGDVSLGNQSAFEFAVRIYEKINVHMVEGIEWDSIPLNSEVSDD